jgi:hypothetical protein
MLILPQFLLATLKKFHPASARLGFNSHRLGSLWNEAINAHLSNPPPWHLLVFAGPETVKLP